MNIVSYSKINYELSGSFFNSKIGRKKKKKKIKFTQTINKTCYQK